MYLRSRNILLDILIFFCKEFINTLNEELAKKLAIRALQRGVGSTEYIDMLLIIEDPENEDTTALTPVPQKTLTEASEADSGVRTLVHPPPSASLERSSEPVPDWCKCGQCRTVPQEIENKCCNMRSRVSLSRRFQKLCLDSEYLQRNIRNTCEIRNDRHNNSSRAFRKAAYRRYITDKYGYLGKNKRKVCCDVVWCCGKLDNTTPHQLVFTWALEATNCT